METSGDTCESFDFVLNNYSVPFVNYKRHILHLCDNGHFIAIVGSTGNVFIRDLYSGEVLKLSDESSARICWRLSPVSGARQDATTAAGQIVSLSHQGHMYVYSVVRRLSDEDGSSHLAITCNVQCHYHSLKHILQDVNIEYHPPHKDGGFLCCYGDVVTFTCGSTVVRLDVPVDRPPEVRSYFLLPDVETLAQVEPHQSGLVMTLDDNKEVAFWSIESGVKVADVCLQDMLGRATQNILHVSLTDDWKHLVVVTPGALDIVSLQFYFETYPQHVTVKHTPRVSQLTPAPGVTGSHNQDSVWRAKLARLKTAAGFGNKRVFDELSWFEKAGLTRTVVMSGQSTRSSDGWTFKKRQSSDVGDSVVTHIVLTAWSDHLSLRDVCAGSQLAYVLLQAENEEEQDVLFAVQVKSGQLAVHRLPHHSAAILSPSVLSPAMAVTSDTLYAVVFYTQQELVVNRLMLYESASMADALCGLNGWNQCCLAVPVLEMALKHRQLDTIAFFLKSRESVFSKSPDSSQQVDDPEHDSTELEELHVVVELLKAAIGEHITDSQLRHYGEQLLQLTMAYLHKLSRNVVAHVHTEDRLHTGSTSVLTQLSNYVVELRGHMNTRTRSLSGQRQKARDLTDGQAGGRQDVQMTPSHKEMVQVWDQLDLKAAVVEGILNQQIPLIQTYVLTRFGRDEADLSNIIRLGLEETMALLCEQEWNYATTMLHNMGFHVPTKLREICYYTSKKSLRDYLAARLQQQGHMTAEELQTLDYMHQIEQIYSCSSFEMAKSLRTEGTLSHWEDVVDLRPVMADPHCSQGAALQRMCGEVAPVDLTNSETASYVHLLLEWVRQWDRSTRHAVVLEQGFYRTDVNVKTLELPAAVVWDYLCRHHHVKHLLQWIESVYAEDTGQPVQRVWPSDLPLDVSVIDRSLTTCPGYLRDILLDALASHGVLCDTEQRDMRLVVKRLARIASVIQQPHLVERRPDTHSVRLSDLHRHLIEWFITHNLPQLLWFYLDYWQLSETDSALTGPGVAVSDWVPTLTRFRSLTRQPHDLQCMLGASVTPGGLEWPAPMHTLDTMVDQGRSLAALTVLALSVQTQNQINRPELTEKMSSVLAQFPRLQRAYFPAQNTSCNVPVGPPDVTVYGLLQGNTEFDLSRLFGWQSTNSLATEESLKELLHFSLESLVSRYARTDSLTFMYYLKQGRPSFAFGTFIASHLKAGAKTIGAKLIHSACVKCHWLALKYFQQSHISAACVAFAEMLGHDSTVMRVHLEAANEIYTHRCSCEAPTNIEQRKDAEKLIQQQTASLLQGCVRHRRKSIENALEQLKAATRWQLEKHRINCDTLTSGQKWLLPLVFCKCHQMAWPTDFLCDCAQRDDWLLFLTYAQLYQFPTAQLRDVLPKFASAHIREHLLYVLDNVPVDGGQPPRPERRTRDVRAQLYSRIGVTNTVTSSTSHNASSSSEDAESDEEDREEEEGEEAEMLIPICEQGLLPNIEFYDLFELLFACGALSQPWRSLCSYAVHLRNPVLAVLAACYDDHSSTWCLCSWLEASLSEDNVSADRSAKEWTLDGLTELVRVMLVSGRVSLLHTAFTIFQPTSQLLSFLEFHLCFTQHVSEEKCLAHLVNFKNAFEQTCHSDGDSHDDGVPLTWIEETVVTIMSHSLRDMTWDSADRLLTLLNQVDVTASFSVPVPPVATLYRLHELTRETSLPLDYAILSQPSHPRYTAVCQHYLDDLTSHHLFDVARQFADITGLSTDHITVQQCDRELSELETSDMWKELDTRMTFWRKCHHLMAKYHTPPQVAARFYEVQAKACPTHSERGCLYQLAYDWLSRDKDGGTVTPDTEEMNRLFIQLWKCKIQDCIQNGKSVRARCDMFGDTHRDRTVTQESLLKCVNTPAVACHSPVTLTQQEKAELDTLLGGLLDECLIADVIRVTTCFGHVNGDLDVVTSCLKLALGSVCVSELAPNVKKLLAVPRTGHRRHTSTSMVTLPRCLSTVSIGTLAALNRESDDNSGDTTLSTMQLLCQRCNHGKQCCTRIIVLYKIAKVLELSLLELVGLEQFEVLRRLLATDQSHKFLHAKSFITTSALADPQVAGFLCDGILSALQVHAGIVAAATTSDGATVPLLLGNPSKKQTCGIGELIQLCGSPSVMGQRLLDSALALMSSSRDASHKILWVMVELLIFAHDCHTLACNMEGICAVLHGCRSVTTTLSLADEYTLMIHLLTGIGRFSEMTYIFDMLKQKHQFELLFRKGIEREDKLKVAILDYLKRYHPADTDTLTMVSLHYTLYRQIAQALEERAQGLLNSLTTKTLVNTPDVSSRLHKALQYFSDAAETYSKEQCLRHAEACVRQARLVALQLHLLPAAKHVLHLSPDGVKAFVTTHHKFYEAYIVCCAYNDHNYWADAVYHQMVERADTKYLTDLRTHVPLTGSLVEDVVERYRTIPAANTTAPVQMKKLLGCCSDIQTAYRLATELGFSDTVRTFLEGEQGNYLQDITA